MNSFIPWVGGKGKLLWIINKLMPDRYTRFIDVFAVRTKKKGFNVRLLPQAELECKPA